ncbi:choice-of-anchor D domain-containing protein [Tunturiibacter gelidiferens]|uniref:Choice-of-anchor D domain-containing protein n=1 Tax=Tunturiibacter gelidiferens TaxID=3069689 RepID=A0AAU7Z3M7_9BACT
MRHFLRCPYLFWCLLLTSVCAYGQTNDTSAPRRDPDSASIRLQRLPLAFEANVGQAVPGTDYLVLTGAMQAELSANWMRLSLPQTNGRSQQLSIRLSGARADAPSHAADKLGGESNYLLGDKISAWHQHVQRYGRVTYEEVYRGIDLTYYGNGSQVEHDYIVHPGATPSSIRLQLDGARKVDLTGSGDLRISVDESEITLRHPHAYQMIGGDRREVPAQFVLADGAVSFHLGDYDRTQPLVIDPVLDYSTFLGNASVSVTAVAVDAGGDTYITGEAPVAFPAMANPATCNSCVTGTNKLAVFVTKLNPAGTAVIYSTFIGGSVDPYNGPSTDQSTALTVDASGDAIVAGSQASADFPLKNPISSAAANFDNGFVLSLTPDGSAFNFSSRLGGGSSVSQSDMVYPESLTTDTTGNVYVSGLSESTSLPVTPGALHAFSPSYGDTGAFLLKLSPTGSLSYGAIVGEIGEASGSTGPTGLAVDGTGIIYMAGTAGVSINTGTTPWPTTSGAYQTSSSDGGPFVTRISADGSTILSSTLVGTGSVSSMSLTPTHDVLIAGDAGYNFPVTPDAYSKNVSTNINGVTGPGALGFFAKVSEDGTQLLYSSAFGPDSAIVTISGIGEDPNGKVWLAGTTKGVLPLVNPLQSAINYQFSGTGFIAEFDPPMHNLLFSGYVNSTAGFSQVNGMAIDSTGLAHVVGIASQDFPTTPGALLGAVTPPPPNYTYNYGFAALIDASKPGPSICFSNATQVTAQVGTTGTGSFDIVNCGNAPLTISSVQITTSSADVPTNAVAFASGNICTGSLAAGASCTLAYTFSPTSAGNFSSAVAIGSNAPMAANLETIYATATAPVVSLLFGNSYSFDPQVLGTTPQSGVALLKNKGNAPLVVDTSRTTITGPFAVTDTTCSSPIPPTSSCVYEFAFNPTVAGAATGTLTLYTNDPGTPVLTIAITGTALASFPVPSVTSPSPATISLDGGPATIFINGTNFFPQSTVFVNGVSVPVTALGSTSIEVTVDPSTLGAMGEFPVQVVNPAPGGASNVGTLTTFHAVSLNATHVVYEPASKLLYAAIPATSASNPNTVISVDPTTGTLGTPIPVLTNPTRLALSDDGHYLYVAFLDNVGASANYNPNGAMLQRIDLTAGAVDRTFTLPNSSAGVIDMHVVPGSPQLLVASLSQAASPSENGVALFNDAGLVQYIANTYPANYTLDSFIFTSDPTTFYGYPIGTSGFFSATSVSATGIIPGLPGGAGCCDQTTGSELATDGTLLYTNSGEVWDPKAQKLLGRYDTNLFYEAAVTADSVAKRTFILDDGLIGAGAPYGDPQILSYDPSTFKLSGVLSFALNSPPSENELLRWGADGFAFRNNESYPADFWTNPVSTSQIILVRSSLATPSAAGGAAVSLSTKAITFPLQAEGLASAAQTVMIQNTGASPLTGLVISLSGMNASSFATTSTCSSTLAAGSSCIVSVVFTPSVAGSNNANLLITDNAPDSPQTVTLTGTGSAPVFTLSSQSLSFGTISTGTLTQQTLALRNSGSIALANVVLAVAGQNSTDFTVTSACGATVAVNATCSLTVSFKPTSTGDESAVLTVGSVGAMPQSVSLGGIVVASDFVLPPPTGASTATISAGQAANFNFSIGTVGTFTGVVTMSCANLPTYATCTFTPSSVTVGSSSTPVSLSINTQQTSTSLFRRRPATPGWPAYLPALAVFALPAISRRTRRRLNRLTLLLCLLGIFSGALLLNGCGGSPGSGSPPAQTRRNTPAGTYTITVVASSGSLIHNDQITLIVQ